VQPQPDYLEQAPVVVYGAPSPIVYGQPYYAERPRHHRHHDRSPNRANGRPGSWGYRDRG